MKVNKRKVHSSIREALVNVNVGRYFGDTGLSAGPGDESPLF